MCVNKKLVLVSMLAIILIRPMSIFAFGDFSFGESNDTNNSIDNWNDTLVEFPTVDSTPEYSTETGPIKENDLIEEDITYTIQFCLDNTQKELEYIDTGLQYTGKLNPQQVKDLLNVIAVQEKGQLLEDANKSVALVDGRIIEIVEKEYEFDEFSNLFKNTKVEINKQD